MKSGTCLCILRNLNWLLFHQTWELWPVLRIGATHRSSFSLLPNWATRISRLPLSASTAPGDSPGKFKSVTFLLLHLLSDIPFHHKHISK